MLHSRGHPILCLDCPTTALSVFTVAPSRLIAILIAIGALAQFSVFRTFSRLFRTIKRPGSDTPTAAFNRLVIVSNAIGALAQSLAFYAFKRIPERIAIDEALNCGIQEAIGLCVNVDTACWMAPTVCVWCAANCFRPSVWDWVWAANCFMLSAWDWDII